jgi:hypothetical protein
MTFIVEEVNPVSSPAITIPFFPRSQLQPKGKTVLKETAHFDDFDNLVTEDDEPVDNIFSEKQQRLLTESLYNNWQPGQGRSFLTLANVGLFYPQDKTPLVPDVLVSLDVKMPDELWEKYHRSYFVSKYGKPPEVAIEIVSNLKGKEAGSKWQKYAKAGVHYYVIFDPERQISQNVLNIYELQKSRYVKKDDRWLEQLELGLILWEGWYEDSYNIWLRWCDQKGNPILVGTETTKQQRQEKEKALKLAEQARLETEKAQQRAEQERREKDQERLKKEKAQQRAEQARREKDQERLEKEKAQEQAEQERQRAERLAAQLRALGLDPDKL